MQFHNPCAIEWTPRQAIKVSEKGLWSVRRDRAKLGIF
jgi:hypothetical protein